MTVWRCSCVERTASTKLRELTLAPLVPPSQAPSAHQGSSANMPFAAQTCLVKTLFDPSQESYDFGSDFEIVLMNCKGKHGTVQHKFTNGYKALGILTN